ncbi:MAG: hypothetical protein RLZZ303_511, partial [Candidatus Hydrogenedentota bacterium]
PPADPPKEAEELNPYTVGGPILFEDGPPHPAAVAPLPDYMKNPNDPVPECYDKPAVVRALYARLGLPMPPNALDEGFIPERRGKRPPINDEYEFPLAIDPELDKPPSESAA